VHISRGAALSAQGIDFIASLQWRCAKCIRRVYFAACRSFAPVALRARKFLISKAIRRIECCWHGRCDDLGKTNDRRKKMTALHTLRTATTRNSLLKNMALFLASPFIGLAYAVLLPFVGFGMLVWIATEGFRKPAAKGAEVAEPVVMHEAPVMRVA
jgi:hypothetical protein